MAPYHRPISALVLAAVVGLALPAVAHARSPDREPEKRAVIEQRLKKLRHEMLRKDVGLDEAKTTQVEGTLDRYRAERKKLRDQARMHRQALRKLLEADSNDQQAYSNAIRGLREAERQKLLLRERELDELGKLLTAKQQAKLMRATHKLKRRLEHKLRQHRRGRGAD